MGEWYRDLFSLKWAIVWPSKQQSRRGLWWSYLHPDQPADLPGSFFVLITLILNFTDCTLLWVTHLSLVEQEVVWNVCETQRAAPSPLLGVPQWVDWEQPWCRSNCIFIGHDKTHRSCPAFSAGPCKSLASVSALCWKLSKSRLCCHGDKGNYLQKINQLYRADSWQKYILMSSFQSQPVFRNSYSYMKFIFTEKFLEKM